MNILPVVLPLLVDRFHLSYSQVGLAAALSNISSSLIQPAFGWASDRWSIRWFMWIGIAWTAILMGCVGLVPNYLVLLLVIFATGVGTAAFHPIASLTVALASGHRRGLGMSFFSAGGNLGFAVGPVVAAWLMGRFGLSGTMAIVLPGLLMSIAMYVWRDECVPPPAACGKQASSVATRVPWRRLTTLCVLITLRSWGYSGLITFIPLLLHERGVSLAVAGRSLFVFLVLRGTGRVAGWASVGPGGPPSGDRHLTPDVPGLYGACPGHLGPDPVVLPGTRRGHAVGLLFRDRCPRARPSAAAFGFGIGVDVGVGVWRWRRRSWPLGAPGRCSGTPRQRLDPGGPAGTRRSFGVDACTNAEPIGGDATTLTHHGVRPPLCTTTASAHSLQGGTRSDEDHPRATSSRVTREHVVHPTVVDLISIPL